MALTKTRLLKHDFPVLGYHPGRNHYKIIPWNNSFCNNLCNYYKNHSTKTFFVMSLPLVCTCLQENMRRNLVCKEVSFFCNFYKINCPKTILFEKCFL